MKQYKANINSINILRVITILLLIVIIYGIKYVVYILKAEFPAFFQAFEGSAVENILVIAAICAAVTAAIYILIFLPVMYSRTIYSVDDKGVGMKTGILIKSSQYMRMDSIQYVLEITTPFSRWTGFNFLVFNGHGSSIAFIFLSQNDAREIAENVRKIIDGRTISEGGAE